MFVIAAWSLIGLLFVGLAYLVAWLLVKWERNG